VAEGRSLRRTLDQHRTTSRTCCIYREVTEETTVRGVTTRQRVWSELYRETCTLGSRQHLAEEVVIRSVIEQHFRKTSTPKSSVQNDTAGRRQHRRPVQNDAAEGRRHRSGHPERRGTQNNVTKTSRLASADCSERLKSVTVGSDTLTKTTAERRRQFRQSVHHSVSKPTSSTKYRNHSEADQYESSTSTSSSSTSSSED